MIDPTHTKLDYRPWWSGINKITTKLFYRSWWSGFNEINKQNRLLTFVVRIQQDHHK